MTDLTEQWKKGELKKGEEYWVILTDEWYSRNPVEPVRAFYSCDCEFEGYLDDDIKEVLAPVPSYEVWKAKLKENAQLKERVYEFVEANQSLRKKLDEERAKNRIDYYDGSPTDFLGECERDRKKNKIYKNLINNIREELIISDLRMTNEGNKFIVGMLSKINQALGEE